MKKIIFILSVLFSILLNGASACRFTGETTPTEPKEITTLIINGDVSVVLVGNSKATLEVIGGEYINKHVSFKKNGDTLTINSTRNKNLKNAGVIYVPAGQLRIIRINSNAQVRSLYALQAPQLDVVINGGCDFMISNIGIVNLIPTEEFTYEHTTSYRRLPANVFNQ
jgi:hypothetical protein